MKKIHVSTRVNGDDVDFVCDPRETLLDSLRDKLALTGANTGTPGVRVAGNGTLKPSNESDCHSAAPSASTTRAYKPESGDDRRASGSALGMTRRAPSSTSAAASSV